MPEDTQPPRDTAAERYHYPEYRSGCRRGDALTCCVVCYIRLLTYPPRYVLRKIFG